MIKATQGSPVDRKRKFDEVVSSLVHSESSVNGGSPAKPKKAYVLFPEKNTESEEVYKCPEEHLDLTLDQVLTYKSDKNLSKLFNIDQVKCSLNRKNLGNLTIREIVNASISDLRKYSYAKEKNIEIPFMDAPKFELTELQNFVYLRDEEGIECDLNHISGLSLNQAYKYVFILENKGKWNDLRFDGIKLENLSFLKDYSLLDLENYLYSQENNLGVIFEDIRKHAYSDLEDMVVL